MRSNLIVILLGVSVLLTKNVAAEDIIIYSFFGNTSPHLGIKDSIDYIASDWPQKHLYGDKLKKAVRKEMSVTAGPNDELEADLYTQMKKLMMLTVVEGKFDEAAPKLNKIKSKYSKRFLQRISHQVLRLALSRANVSL